MSRFLTGFMGMNIFKTRSFSLCTGVLVRALLYHGQHDLGWHAGNNTVFSVNPYWRNIKLNACCTQTLHVQFPRTQANNDVGFGTIIGSAVFNVLFVIGLCGVLVARTCAWHCK